LQAQEIPFQAGELPLEAREIPLQSGELPLQSVKIIAPAPPARFAGGSAKCAEVEEKAPTAFLFY
jgi:hypothetical protein